MIQSEFTLVENTHFILAVEKSLLLEHSGYLLNVQIAYGRPAESFELDTSTYDIQMVIPPPVRPPRVTQFLKPYVLKMHFTNQYVNAQVTHSPTATVASAASSQEKALRSTMENTRDVAAAAKIGKILGERLLLKDIPAVTVFLNRNQKYHGKVKAVIDSLREVVILPDATKEEKGNKYDALKYKVGVYPNRWCN
ncbi:hypothetical protein NC653_019298 [Populus alba x Populus x berolinensis]|uniref:Uncharacterized protein n=1 Tax=Populus alba x Populus x berolinensis TaxID=444605 RepID=A0AAD6QIK0_9ROSI|nr:hypothetical protein NC653_019298 [Populus alba x Populus x berolinensis]